MTAAVDEKRVEQLMGKLVGYMTGAALCSAIWLGDELGFYSKLEKIGPATADALAKQAGTHPRLTREWLDSQAAGGLVSYDAASDTYSLPPEAALALANDGAPVFVARAMNAVGSFYIDIEKVKKAFRGDGALSWGDHHPCLFHGTEWFFRTGYRAYLPSQWIPALDGVAAKLAKGARVADVGCGHGASVVVMAQAFPQAQFWGFDFHAPSIETAKKRCQDAGVANRTEFAVATAKTYAGGPFDLICFFDCLHDMGDPIGVARHARSQLAPDGTILVVEPFAIDGRAANLAQNPMAALLYAASSSICTPNSLSQEVGAGLGAQAGEAKLREVFEKAGFKRFRRAAATPLNMILEARP